MSSWPRETEVTESPEGLITTLDAYGNRAGVTFWSYEVKIAGWYVGGGTAVTRTGARIAAWMIRRDYRRNGS